MRAVSAATSTSVMRLCEAARFSLVTCRLLTAWPRRFCTAPRLARELLICARAVSTALMRACEFAAVAELVDEAVLKAASAEFKAVKPVVVASMDTLPKDTLMASEALAPICRVAELPALAAAVVMVPPARSVARPAAVLPAPSLETAKLTPRDEKLRFELPFAPIAPRVMVCATLSL